MARIDTKKLNDHLQELENMLKDDTIDSDTEAMVYFEIGDTYSLKKLVLGRGSI